MFSKALFKQSCKANGVMWSIISFAVCFMLACVMLISGSGNIGKTKNAIEDTIIRKEIDSAIEERSINYYSIADESLKVFDKEFVKAFDGVEYMQTVANLIAGGMSAPDAQTAAAVKYYTIAATAVKTHAEQKAISLGYKADGDEAKEILGVSIFALNPELIKDDSKELYDLYISKTDDILSTY